MTAKFIVIEGGDGSGKETQAQLLVKYLKNKNVPVLYLDFPQYEGFFGKLVAAYLRGEYGPIGKTSPFLISIIYALDRTTVREKIANFLQSGGVVVANRYVPSNVAHQAANISDHAKRTEFIHWIQQLEYDELKIPREDIVIYLDLPWELSMQKSEEKLQKDTHHNYLEGKADIHEKSSEHRQKTVEIYRHLQKTSEHWHLVSCVSADGKQRSPDEIHKEIRTLLNL